MDSIRIGLIKTENADVQNKEIASQFKLLSKLTELHEGNAFKARSYANAAFQIGRLDVELADMEPADINKLQGVGKAISSKIAELLAEGKMAKLSDFLAQTPPGLLELLSIKGLGGKKLGTIWKELEVESPGELLYACHENRLALLKGFGQKTQDSVIKSIEFYDSNRGRFLYAKIEEESAAYLEKLREATAGRVEFSGAFRRRCPIIEEVDFLIGEESLAGTIDQLNSDQQDFSAKLAAAIPLDWQAVSLDQLPLAKSPEGLNLQAYQATSAAGFKLRVFISPPEQFACSWLYTTATAEHLLQNDLIKYLKADVQEEATVYQAAQLPFVAAELRESKLSGDEKPDELISLQDIKGIVHSHSRWSDGTHSLEQMATGAKEAGYGYLVISDHSRSAVYAGGLTAERVALQQEEIEQLNEKLAPFQIFKSIESDILTDGSLDYPTEVLASFDLVIASVHSGLKMDIDKATSRLIKAIENPYTTILGHATGRLLLAREGYPIDHIKIIDACSANQVVIELNANPNRLDMDWTWIPSAVAKGCMISVNPDAHSIAGMQDLRYGIYAARKGGLLKSQCWNSRSAAEIEDWLKVRKEKRSNLV